MTALLFIAHAGLWIAVVVQGLAICVLLYKNNRLLDMVAQGGIGDHLAAGSLGPQFRTTDLRTGKVVSQEQFVGTRASVLFVTPTCRDCHRLMKGLATVLAGSERADSLLAFCDGANRNCIGSFGKYLSGVPLLAEENGNIAERLGIRARPALVELDAAWRIVGYSYPSTPEHVVRILPESSDIEVRP